METFRPIAMGMGLKAITTTLRFSQPAQFLTNPNPYSCSKLLSQKGRSPQCRRSLVRATQSRQPLSSLGFYALKKDMEHVRKRVEMMSSAWLKQEEEILADLELWASKSNIWDDLAQAHETLHTFVDTAENVTELKDLQSKVEDARLIVQLAEMEGVNSWFVDEAFNIVRDINKSLHRYELSKLLSGVYDKEGACLIVTAGDGSSDAQEWANMLLKMYLRWAEKNRYKTSVAEMSSGEGVGIKSAMIEFEKRFAYGFLSGEKGIHQIIRRSASGEKNLEQVNTAVVDVMPLFLENSVELELPDEDLEISYSSLGVSSNRSLNKAEMEVHIVHIPTGISVHYAGERNQLANKIKALYRLKAKLLAIATEQQTSGIKHIRGDIVEANLMEPIRKYVFYPKMFVQDLRTGIQVSDMSILDGDFEPLIKDYLIFKYMKNMIS